MYSLKPILVDQKIDLPTCMYTMKPIKGNISEDKEQIEKSEKSEIDLLEERQNRILKRLDELKETLLAMRGDFTAESKLTQEQQQPQTQTPKRVKGAPKVQKKPIDVNNLAELVVNVHPKNIPYSILAFKNLWKYRLVLQAEVFTHSSISDAEISNLTREFTEKISQPANNSKLPVLKITIIWKNVETTQFITSPSKFIPVYGEINIIRYLNRLGPSEFSYEIDDSEANLHDQVLDVCYQLSKKHTNKERQQFVNQLSKRLGNGQFYNNATSLSISDIAVSSILKKLYVNNYKEMPASLSKWLENISLIAGY